MEQSQMYQLMSAEPFIVLFASKPLVYISQHIALTF